MKSLLTASLLFLSSTGLAAVADQFRCELVYKDPAKGEEIRVHHDVAGIRLPIAPDSTSQNPDITYTSSDFSSDFERELGKNAGLQFKYQIAVEKNEDGTPKRAAFDSCTATSQCNGNVCEATACASSANDPFGPDSRWTPLSFNSDGTAIFPQGLSPTAKLSFGEAELSVNCQFLGTVR